MASDLSLMSKSQKEEIVKNMKEMFSHLDPEVIYIVLSGCGFKGRSHGSVPANFKQGAKQLACLLACGAVERRAVFTCLMRHECGLIVVVSC